jgi:hypothetical protein
MIMVEKKSWQGRVEKYILSHSEGTDREALRAVGKNR